MTATTVAPTGTAATTRSDRRPGPLRRHRSALVVGLAALAAVVVAVLLGTGVETSTPMDPDNPGPDGTRALARVLARDGVDVRVARSAGALDKIDVDASTTVVVVEPENLGRSTARRLLRHTAAADHVVVVGAGPGVVHALHVGDDPEPVSLAQGRDARCGDPRFSGLRLEADAAVAYAHATCFTGAHGGLVAAPSSGSVDNLTLFGADQALTNDQILRADNAAVALRLLGQDHTLVWYVPSISDQIGGDGVSLQSLLPRWLRPGLWLGALVLASVVLWRVRRLGALAAEPLPVTVRAVETTRSLGRLYRRSGDRLHAAEALRRAARVRCAERLRLGSAAAPDAVVREVAHRTGRRQDAVSALLGPDGAVPSTDRDLISLAQELTELDREVRRT